MPEPNRLTVAFDAIQARFDASEPISVGGIGELLDAWYEERGRIAELESKLARWRKVVQSACDAHHLDPESIPFWLRRAVEAISEKERTELRKGAESVTRAGDAIDPIAAAVDALSGSERAELLEEGDQ